MADSLTLLDKKEVAEGTMEFFFEKTPEFSFTAGQTIDVILINPPETDVEGNRRTFSICAAPQEPYLAIATRIRDTAFKRTLNSMEVGTEVSIEGPFGSFVLHENVARPAVFVAGGIGVTPFRSMALDAARRELAHKIFLFYSNRRPEDAPFLRELQELEAANANFKLVATMTDMEKSTQTWEGEHGYINPEMIAKYVVRDSTPIYYLAGPQGMVLAVRDSLKASGVSMDDIRYEEFAGY